MKFVRVPFSSLFVAAFHADNPREARSGFILWQDDGRSEITLQTSWGKGAYAFWPSLKDDLPHDWATFEWKIRQQFRNQNKFVGDTQEVRFGWFSRHGVADDDWITVTPGTSGPGSSVVTKAVAITLGNKTFRMNIAGQGVISVKPNHIEIGTSKFQHSLQVDSEDNLENPGELKADGPLIISFKDAPSNATLSFEATMDQNSQRSLGVHLRFSRAKNYDPDFHTAQIASSRYSLFTYEGKLASTHKLLVRIDIHRPYDFEWSYFTFANAKAHGRTPLSEAFLSYFETTDGNRIGFIPIAGARLVIMESASLYRAQDGGFPPERKRNYLAPHGQFELMVPGDKGGGTWPKRHLMLTGLSRTEYLAFTPRRPGTPGNVIEFVAGQPAVDYREITRNVNRLGTDEDSVPSLTQELMTSWMRLLRNVGPSTEASRQPERATLHGQPEGLGAEGGDARLLNFQPHLVLHDEAIPIVPLLGLAETQDSSADAVTFEQTLLADERSRRLKPLKVGLGADFESTFAYTPKGFQIRRRDDGGWKELLVAQFPDAPEAKAKFALVEICPELVDIFMKNQMFVVLTELQDLKGKKLFDLKSEFEIAGWSFKASLPLKSPLLEEAPPDSATLPTTLIAKFRETSIEKLINDSSSWSNGSLLDRGHMMRLQQALKDYVEKTKELKEADEKNNPGVSSRYQQFLDILTKPEWNGFLLLNLEIDLMSLPLQIKGLLGGVDSSVFNAHHIGVSINRLEWNASGLSVKTGSVFGLVDYPPLGVEKLPNPNQKSSARNDQKYDFKIEKLSVQFQNSEIIRFDCRVNTYIGAFFSDSVKSVNGIEDKDSKVLAFDGQYESRMVNAKKFDTYTFIHQSDYEFELDTLIFKNLKVTKMQFVTVSSEPLDGNKERITTRIALWGSIEFLNLSDELQFPGIKKLDFDDLGITFEFDLGRSIKLPDLRPNFDVGQVRFELPETKFGDGFLSKLPFKLKFFQTAPSGDKIKLTDEGFFGMSLGGMDLPQFRFGLGFDMDLGSLGALVSKLEGIRLTILFGWLPKGESGNSKGYCIGLRFEGGGGPDLDIGLQGIFRLTAEDYEFAKVGDGDDAYFMIALNRVHLYLFGTKIPENEGFSLFLFAPPGNQSAEKVGWFMGMECIDILDGVKIKYLGLGQRIKAYTLNGVTTTKQVVNQLISKVGEAQTAVDVKKKFDKNQVTLTYAPDREWTVALSTLVYKIFDLDIVFMDTEIYGAHLRVPSERNALKQILFDTDILYRKITDDIGVYSTEVVLSDSLRQIELGAASLTLPKIGLEIWTDGGVTIDLGHPGDNLDFSRSFTIQMVPFLGSGGLIYSRINGIGARTLPKPVDQAWKYDPVMRVAFAARVGLGKEISKGILRAGLSLSLFGMIEGTWGGRRQNTELEPISDKPEPPDSYMILAGRWGVVGEIFGYVDFGIIRAGVSVRIWASIGVVIETWQPTILYFEAGVSVRVAVVIARIKIFGQRIEIKASFSFSARLRYDWQVGSKNCNYNSVFGVGPSAGRHVLPFGSRGEPDSPFSWDSSFAVWGGAKKPLPIWFTPDATLDDSGLPQVVIMMMAEGGPEADGTPGTRPFDHLIEAMVTWAIHERFKADKPTIPTGQWALTLDEIDALAASLAKPFTLSRSDSVQPLDYEALRTFLANNFDLIFIDHPMIIDSKTQSKGGALFPAPSELILRIEDSGMTEDIPLANLRKVSKTYQDNLEDFFEQCLTLIEKWPREHGLGANDERLVIEVLFEDYFALLVKGGVEELKQAHIALASATATVTDLLQRMAELAETPNPPRDDAFSRLAATAGRYQMHGLRVSDPDRIDTTLAFFDLAQLQRPIRLDWDAAMGETLDYKLSLTSIPNAWFKVETGVSKLDQDAVEGMRMAGVNLAPDIAPAATLPELRGQNRHYGFADPIEIKRHDNAPANALNGFVWPISESLRAVLRRQVKSGGGGLALKLKVGDALDQTCTDTEILTWRWVTRIPVHISRVRRAGTGESNRFVPNVYAIGGVTEANRYALDRLYTDQNGYAGTNLNRISIFLIHDSIEGRGVQQQVYLNRDASFVFKNNLSSVARPHGFEVDGFGADEPSESLFAANFTDAQKADLLQLLRQGSVVNSGGYFLHVKLSNGGDLPDFLFGANDSRASVTLMLVFDGEGNIVHDYHTGAYIPHASAPNAVAAATESGSKSFLYAESEDKVFEPVFEPGSIGLSIVRASPSRCYKRIGVGDGSPRVTIEEALAGLDLAAMSEVERTNVMIQAGEVEVELEERFNLMEWEISDAHGFADIHGDRVLPVGPCDFEADDEVPEGCLRTDWLYEQVLPVYKFAVENINKPEADRKIYAGVGRTLPLILRFRDIYGNRLPNRQAEHRVQLDIRYFDPLVHPASLPGVVSLFDWGAAKTKAITVTLRFNRKAFYRGPKRDMPYDPQDQSADNKALGQRIKDALTLYRRALQQLQDPKVTLQIFTSLRSSGVTNIPVDKRDDLLRFVLAGEQMLSSLLNGDRPRNVTRWHSTVSIARMKADFFVELSVDLVMRRPKNLVCQIAQDNDYTVVWEVVAPCAAAVSAVDSASDTERLTVFAKRFADLAVGRVLATGVGAEGGKSFWVIKENVIDLKIDWNRAVDGPGAFVPPPLSTELRAAEFDYQDPMASDGAGIKKHASVRDVDLDNYMRAYIQDLQRFLSPEIAVSARSLDGRAVDIVLQSKRTIARFFARSIDSVIVDTRKFVAQSLSTAIDTFEDRLKTDLASAYSVDSILAYPLRTNAAYAQGGGPSLYGRINLPKEDAEVPYTFRPVKVRLDLDQPWLIVLFDSKRETQSQIDMYPTYRITHVERTFAREDYRPTAWLRLILEKEIPLSPPCNGHRKPVSVPVPLRRYPKPPSLIQQNFALCEGDKPDKLEDWMTWARSWQFQLEYARRDVNQDAIYATITYNNENSSSGISSNQVENDAWLTSVLEKLLAYRKYREVIWKSLNKLPTRDESLDTARAVRVFSGLTEQIASALGWDLAADGSPVEALTDRFVIRERSGNDGTRIISVRWIDPPPARQAQELEVLPVSATGQLIFANVTPVANGVDAVYPHDCLENREKEGVWLRRRMRLLGLDVLSTENAWSGVELRRNELLVDRRETNSKFIYKTSFIRFGEYLTPTVERFDAADISESCDRTAKAHVLRMLKVALNKEDAVNDKRDRSLFDIGWGYDNELLCEMVPELDQGLFDNRAPAPHQRLVALNAALVGDVFGTEDSLEGVAEKIGNAISALMNQHKYPILSSGPDGGKPQGSFVFDLAVYARVQGEDKPTLLLRNLRLPLARITSS